MSTNSNQKKIKTKMRRTFRLLFKIGLVCFVLGCVAIGGVVWHYGSDPNLPQINSLLEYNPNQVSRLVTQKGDVIGEIFKERRSFIVYEDIPQPLIHAFVDAEDNNFFRHKGLDYIGMLRALWVNISKGKKKQGASTITQQVVKTFLLTRERIFKRKFQEIILARRLESSLSKQEILTLYLNQIYLGHGRYGIVEASRFYFGKEVADLNYGEIATLASLPKAPERLSPKKKANQKRIKNRQNYVLRQMVVNNHLSQKEAQHWIESPIETIAEPFPALKQAPEWVDIMRQYLTERYGKEKLFNLGKTVVATVDLEFQQKATEALRKGLLDLDIRQSYGRVVRSVKENKIDREIRLLKKAFESEKPPEGPIYEAVVTAVHDANGSAPGELVVDWGIGQGSALIEGIVEHRFNPEEKTASQRFAIGDVVKVVPTLKSKALPQFSEQGFRMAPGPEGAMVVLDPKTRHVLALVGGYKSRVADFNRALRAKRQPGSAFKPFVYTAAIESHKFTAATVINDAPEIYEFWKPKNYIKGKFEGRVRLRQALARSINTVAIRIMNQVKPRSVVDIAHKMGIQSELPLELSLALGSGEVTPIELVNAFCTFASGGKFAEPKMIIDSDIELDLLNVEQNQEYVGEQVIAEDAAYVMIDMLRSVVTEGTGGRARALKIDVVGKTGTSNDARDAWFIGMMPDLVVGVWVGFDFPYGLGRGEHGSRTAAPIFVEFAQSIKERLKGEFFHRPDNIITVRIDNRTGLLAAPSMPDADTRSEVFIEGTEPKEVAPSLEEYDLDSFTLKQYGSSP